MCLQEERTLFNLLRTVAGRAVSLHLEVVKMVLDFNINYYILSGGA